MVGRATLRIVLPTLMTSRLVASTASACQRRGYGAAVLTTPARPARPRGGRRPPSRRRPSEAAGGGTRGAGGRGWGCGRRTGGALCGGVRTCGGGGERGERYACCAAP